LVRNAPCVLWTANTFGAEYSDEQGQNMSRTNNLNLAEYSDEQANILNLAEYGDEQGPKPNKVKLRHLAEYNDEQGHIMSRTNNMNLAR